MKMVSMVMKADKEGKSDCCCCATACSCEPDKPRYPWGLQINLEQEQLDALGMKDLPKVGSSMVLTCTVKVTMCREEEREEGAAERCVSMQIVEIGTNGPEKGMFDHPSRVKGE